LVLDDEEYYFHVHPSGPDAVLSLDLDPPRTEAHQYKHVKTGHFNFQREHGNAAGDNDVFVLFCTSSVPSLRNGDSYNVPPRSLLIAEENWDQYFGLYVGRSYLVAKEIFRKRKFGDLEDSFSETDDLPRRRKYGELEDASRGWPESPSATRGIL
jgi:hypothetical protein